MPNVDNAQEDTAVGQKRIGALQLGPRKKLYAPSPFNLVYAQS
jgi:hypothetical protein